MSSMSYVSSSFHCVFSTKERQPTILPRLRERLWPFLGGIHRKMTFQQEFVALLKKHRIAYDERYLGE